MGSSETFDRRRERVRTAIARLTLCLDVAFHLLPAIPDAFACIRVDVEPRLEAILHAVLRVAKGVKSGETYGDDVEYFDVLLEVFAEVVEVLKETTSLYPLNPARPEWEAKGGTILERLAWALEMLRWRAGVSSARGVGVYVSPEMRPAVVAHHLRATPERVKVVCIVGSPGTGKSALAREIATHLVDSHWATRVEKCRWMGVNETIAQVLLARGELGQGSSPAPTSRSSLRELHRRAREGRRDVIIVEGVPSGFLRRRETEEVSDPFALLDSTLHPLFPSMPVDKGHSPPSRFALLLVFDGVDVQSSALPALRASTTPLPGRVAMGMVVCPESVSPLSSWCLATHIVPELLRSPSTSLDTKQCLTPPGPVPAYPFVVGCAVMRAMRVPTPPRTVATALEIAEGVLPQLREHLAVLYSIVGGDAFPAPLAAFALHISLTSAVSTLRGAAMLRVVERVGPLYRIPDTAGKAAGTPAHPPPVGELVAVQLNEVLVVKGEVEHGSVKGGLQRYLDTLPLTRRAIMAGLRTTEGPLFLLTLRLLILAAAIEEEHLCAFTASTASVLLQVVVCLRECERDTAVRTSGGTVDGASLDGESTDGEEEARCTRSVPPAKCDAIPRDVYPKDTDSTIRDACDAIRDAVGAQPDDAFWGALAIPTTPPEACDGRAMLAVSSMAYTAIARSFVHTRIKHLRGVGLVAAKRAMYLVDQLLGDSSQVTSPPVPFAIPLPPSDTFTWKLADSGCDDVAVLRSLRDFVQHETSVVHCEAIESLSESYHVVGEYHSSLRTAKSLREKLEGWGDVPWTATHLMRCAVRKLHGGSPREALEDCTQAEGLHRDLGMTGGTKQLLVVGEVSLALGRYFETIAVLSRCVGGDPPATSSVMDLRGVLDNLPSIVHSSGEGCDEVDDMYLVGEGLLLLGRLQLELGRPTEAILLERKAGEVLGCSPLLHKVHAVLAEAHAATAITHVELLGALHFAETAEGTAISTYGASSGEACQHRLQTARILRALHILDEADAVGRKVLYCILGEQEGCPVTADNLVDVVDPDPEGEEEGAALSEDWERWVAGLGANGLLERCTTAPGVLVEALGVLCEVRLDMGDIDGAVFLADTALSVLSASLSSCGGAVQVTSQHTHPLHCATPHLLSLLGLCYMRRESPAEALPHFASAVRVTRVLYGHRHLRVAEHLDHLACAYTALRNHEAAFGAFCESFDLRCATLLDDSISDVSSLSSASSSGIQEEWLSSLLGQLYAHPLLAASLQHVGRSLFVAGRVKEAMGLLRKALEMLDVLYSRASRQYAEGLLQYGDLLFSASRWREAERAFTTSLEVASRVCNERDPLVPRALTSLALAKEKSGSYDVAYDLLSEALRREQRNPHCTRGAVAQSMYNLGMNCYTRKDLGNAAAFFEMCRNLRRDAGLAEDHHLVYSVQHWLEWVDYVSANPDQWTPPRASSTSSTSSSTSSSIPLYSRAEQLLESLTRTALHRR